MNTAHTKKSLTDGEDANEDSGENDAKNVKDNDEENKGGDGN